MQEYSYSPLRERDGLSSIRLLRILPNEDDNAPLECQLFDYYIPTGDPGSHIYEALSYVWGKPEKTHFIVLDGCVFRVTGNLHAALSRLRNRYLERNIWVDAIAINQSDLDERGHQIQYMPRIYGVARCVIVWLGEAADGSDAVIENIRLAAYVNAVAPIATTELCYSVLALLERPWFRRIWILQEVAAARHILMTCGKAQIDGYTFCAGLHMLSLPSSVIAKSQGLIRSVAALISQANLRPRSTTWWSGRTSLGIGTMSELIDMYHLHEATEKHDKVFALLGMSMGNPSTVSLTPDYNARWPSIFNKLLRFMFGRDLKLKVLGYGDLAVIKARGSITGKVVSVDRAILWGETQNVLVSAWDSETRTRNNAWLTFRNSAKLIREGDMLCIVQSPSGLQRRMIVRACKDYFYIIKTTAIPVRTTLIPDHQKRKYIEWVDGVKSIEPPTPDLVLVWDWNASEQESFRDLEFESLEAEWRVLLTGNETLITSKAERLVNTALALAMSEDQADAKTRIHDAIQFCEATYGAENEHTLKCIDALELMYKSRSASETDEEAVLQVLHARVRMQGSDHPDTVRNLLYIKRLALTYDDAIVGSGAKRLRAVARFIEGAGQRSFSVEDIISIITSLDARSMLFFFELRGHELELTEEILKAAAGAWSMDEDAMSIVLDNCEDKVKITEEVVIAAASNFTIPSMLRCFINKRSVEVKITERIMEAVAGNMSGNFILAYLLEERGSEVKITKEVIRIAATNPYGDEILDLLLHERGYEVQITEEIVIAAAGNLYGKEVLARLLEERGHKVEITDKVIKAAAANPNGEETLRLLLQNRGDDMVFTEDIIKAAASNESSGAMRLLLRARGDEINITEAIVEAVAGNTNTDMMDLILQERGNEIQITEAVVKVAAQNAVPHMMGHILALGDGSIRITEEILVVAAENHRGHEIVLLLVKYRQRELEITSRVMEAAARSASGHLTIPLLDQVRKRQHVHIRVFESTPFIPDQGEENVIVEEEVD